MSLATRERMLDLRCLASIDKAVILFFYRWNISVIFSWDILVTETFRSFVSQLFQNSP